MIVCAVFACFVLAMAFSSKPAEAAGVEKAIAKISSVGNSNGVTELGQPPNVPPTTKPVKPPKPPKPDRSDKDGNPDDGNNGGGNDDRETEG